MVPVAAEQSEPCASEAVVATGSAARRDPPDPELLERRATGAS
jgi:hypothetical protein